MSLAMDETPTDQDNANDFVITPKIRKDWDSALSFTQRTHQKDIDWIKTRNTLTRDFDDFFYNYIYVVIASGFKGATAARLTPKLFACSGDLDEMRKVFKNEQKITAIHDVYELRSKWGDILKTLTTVDSLKQFPRIGDVVKFHLARNIGLISCAKPDLHLVRYCAEQNCSDPHVLIDALARLVGMAAGTVDFVMWVWLSHSRGTKEMKCCNSEFMLR
ncbi:hypothetical protein BLNAU_5406 [Blattamonas nauphoetae]|uniref:Uncharacterized protein n=1 Tax=Blattamonas nauphoetae TaxID=2049346 RepID=A0ABQ9Y7D6_9EUKA|nr:hypothetical protein BLNAU_5406 [Blattamonas nauphoetae]